MNKKLFLNKYLHGLKKFTLKTYTNAGSFLYILWNISVYPSNNYKLRIRKLNVLARKPSCLECNRINGCILYLYKGCINVIEKSLNLLVINF